MNEPKLDWLPSTNNYRGNQGDTVFFYINVKELFNINLQYPGILRALDVARKDSLRFCPRDTRINGKFIYS